MTSLNIFLPRILDINSKACYTIDTTLNKMINTIFEREKFMEKEEILERNKNSSSANGDERELLISGRANIVSKGVVTVAIILLIVFKNSKGLNTDDLWGIFFVYCSSEAFYKYYFLKQKSILFFAIIFALAATYALGAFLFPYLGIKL